jgi:prepilin peptidase CpaA
VNAEVVIAVALGLAAVITDLRRREIPNWIPVAALIGGIACQVVEKGWLGLGSALLGAVTGFAVFLVFYLLGGMGGGDVKLMAGFGALLGAGRLLEAALWTAGIGGLMALLVLGTSWVLAKLRRRDGASALPRAIPYAPAIVCGVWVALIPKG